MEWQPSENGGPPKFVEIPGSERVGGGRDGWLPAGKALLSPPTLLASAPELLPVACSGPISLTFALHLLDSLPR